MSSADSPENQPLWDNPHGNLDRSRRDEVGAPRDLASRSESPGRLPENDLAGVDSIPVIFEPDSSEGDHSGQSTSSSSQVRAYPAIAWFVILVAVGTIAALNSGLVSQAGRAGAINAVQDMQNRYLVGTLQMPGASAALKPQIEAQLSSGKPSMVLPATLLVAEMEGADAALRELDQRLQPLSLTPKEAESAEALRTLYQQRIAGTLNQPAPFPPEKNAVIVKEFGWLGRLGLNPKEGGDLAVREQLLVEARRTLMTMFGAFGLAGCAGFLGLLLLLLFAALAATGRLSFRLKPGTGTGGLYAEMFAVWFVLFFALNLGLVGLFPPSVRVGVAGVASLLSLVSLGWPVWRGLPWSQVRQELGLVGPSGGLADIGLGVLAYIAGLPVVFVGMLGTVVMMQLMSQLATVAIPLADVPAHPIVELFARGSLAEKLQAVAVVLLVPITEEIMFRGALYRHLREASGRWGFLMSLAFSTLFSAFLFAVIHPQGPAGVPLLMSIAIVLAVVREWRGSLVSPIVTHMVVNGVTTSVALLAFS